MADPAKLRAAFAVFDADGSGTLSADEIVGILTRPGSAEPLTTQEAQEFINENDLECVYLRSNSLLLRPVPCRCSGNEFFDRLV